VESHTIPDDFAAALARNKKATAGFEGLSPFVRKQFLYRLNSAKRPETRQKRIAELVAAAEARSNPFTTRRPAPPTRGPAATATRRPAATRKKARGPKDT
jgi:hypothetical protein